MCWGGYSGGGGSSSSETKAKKVTHSWYIFWKNLEDTIGKQGIFIETVRGCKNVSCKLQCHASRETVTKMSFDELNHIITFFQGADSPENFMLYGMGDATLYDWKVYIGSGREIALGNYRINLSPDIKMDQYNEIYGNGMGIYFNVNSPEDVVKVNRIKGSENGHGVTGIVIPVMRGNNWLEMFKRSTTDIEFNSYTPDNSGFYVSPKEFKNVFDLMGIQVKPTVYTMKPGFKPVIEGCELLKDGTLNLFMRRCFQLDSKKMTIDVPYLKGEYDDLRSWEFKTEKKLVDKLTRLMNSKTSCEECTKIAWHYNYKRN